MSLLHHGTVSRFEGGGSFLLRPSWRPVLIYLWKAELTHFDVRELLRSCLVYACGHMSWIRELIRTGTCLAMHYLALVVLKTDIEVSLAGVKLGQFVFNTCR